MKMGKKKFVWWIKNHCKIILLVIFALALLIGNICIIVFVDSNVRSDWLTLYSGWVSGIATAILGIIAVIQSKNYKNDNDEFLNEQQRINSQLMQDQYDLSWRKNQYDIYNAYSVEFLELEKAFRKHTVAEIVAQALGTSDKNTAIVTVAVLVQRIQNNLIHAFAYLMQCKYYCEGKVKLYELIKEYVEKMEQFSPILQAAIIRKGVLQDINSDYLIKAKELAELENTIDLTYYEISSNIVSFIYNIFDQDIAVAKSSVHENLGLQNQWLSTIKDE